MQILMTYTGTIRDFRSWLAVQRNIVNLIEYREKKAAKKAANRKPFKPSIA